MKLLVDMQVRLCTHSGLSVTSSLAYERHLSSTLTVLPLYGTVCCRNQTEDGLEVRCIASLCARRVARRTSFPHSLSITLMSQSHLPVHINHLNYVESTFFANTTIITPILARKPDACVTWPSAALFWALGEGGFEADGADTPGVPDVGSRRTDRRGDEEAWLNAYSSRICWGVLYASSGESAMEQGEA